MKNRLFTPAILLLPLWFGLNTKPNEYKIPENASSALSIFLYSASNATEFDGETQIMGSGNFNYHAKKALEIKNFGFSNVQNLYLDQGQGLRGNVKAGGNRIVFETRASKAIPYLYTKLVTGGQFADMVFEVVSLAEANNPRIYDKIELKLVLVSSVKAQSVDKTTGEVTYMVTIEYGAIKRTMTDYDQFGAALPPTVINWSYVKNNNSFDI
jgi:type VI protein secretion system component Hcp